MVSWSAGALAVSPFVDDVAAAAVDAPIAMLHSAHDRRAPAQNLWQTGI
jgi:hypothetical protein